MNWNCWNQ